MMRHRPLNLMPAYAGIFIPDTPIALIDIHRALSIASHRVV